MKYTTPTYEVEAVETVDVITASTELIPGKASIVDVMGTDPVTGETIVVGKEVAIYDVNILL